MSGVDASAVRSSSWATISVDQVYRYELGRSWGDGPCDVWIMLNPSTATADVDDPTIRRCIGFSRRWGAGALAVVNLFALRSTDPKALLRHPDPIGPANDDYIAEAASLADAEGGRVIAAWGAHAMAAERGRQVRKVAGGLLALGTTKAGAPRHPLYVRGDAQLTPWFGR